MKKKFFLMLPCIAAVAIATFVGKKTFESYAYEASSLLMQNVEALADPNEDWSDCPRDKFIRNAQESWSKNTVQYDAEFGFYITIKGRKIELGAGAKTGGDVYVPTCPHSSGNCCEKAHLDKPFKYV